MIFLYVAVGLAIGTPLVICGVGYVWLVYAFWRNGPA
jgi:hypothetical protein